MTCLLCAIGLSVIRLTGAGTEFGAIAGRFGEAQPQTGFQAGLRDYSKMLVTVTVIMAVVILVVNLLIGRSAIESVLFALSIAVGLTPQLLPAIVTREPLHRRPPAGQAQGDREASGRDRGSRQHRCLLHGQDGHTHGRSDQLLGGAGPGGATLRAVVLRDGLVCNEAVIGDGKAVGGNPLDRALWQAPDADRIGLAA